MPFFALALSALLSLSLAAPSKKAPAPTSYTLDAGKSKVSFDLRSSLTDIHGAAGQVSGTLSFVGKDGVTGRLDVPVAGLSTGLGVRDARMQTYALGAAQHPNISFEVTGASNPALLSAGTGSGPVDLNGTLTVRGQSRPVTVHANAAWTDGALVLTGAVPLLWTDFGVPDPSVGFSTVFPSMNVSFNVQLRPGA